MKAVSHFYVTLKDVPPEALDGIARSLAREQAMREQKRRHWWALVLFGCGLGMACYHAWLSVMR